MSDEYADPVIAADLDRYCKALVNNQISICVAIEKQYDLYGYPPFVVTEVMAAGARGEDMVAAEDRAIGATE